MTRIALVGAGAIGCAYTTRLAVAGDHEVTVCARTPFDELVSHTSEGVLRARPRVVTSPAGLEPVELVIVAVKAGQEPGLAPWLEVLAAPETRLLVLQNGVEHVARMRPVAGPAEIVPAVVRCPAERLEPGHVHQREHIRLDLPDDRHGRWVAKFFAGSGVDVRLVEDFHTAAWTKLCINISHGAVVSLTGRPLGVFRGRADLRALALELVIEAAAAARADGADLNEAFPAEVVARLTARDPADTPSILVDRLNGNPLEADGQNGAVVRAGERHGIPTPMNRTMLALMSAVNWED